MNAGVVSLVILSASVSLLAGCASGPDFVRPAPISEVTYTAVPMSGQVGTDAIGKGGVQQFHLGEVVDARWWRRLGSSRLDAYIEGAFLASPTLAAAAATLRQAEEIRMAQAAVRTYPGIHAGVSAQRQRMNPGMLGIAGNPREFSLYTAGLEIRHRLDLSGGTRRTLEALTARVDHRYHEMENARLRLAAGITLTAIRRASLADQSRATLAILDVQIEQEKLVGGQVLIGLASEEEMLALRVRTEQTRATLHQLQRQIEQEDHTLAMLAGRAPGSAAVPAFNLGEFVLPGDLPVVLPSALARHRPDIQAAEALLHAANAEYGVAISKLYPQVNLSATLGSQGMNMDSLFGGGAAIWSVIGQLTQPLLNPGLPAERRASLAALEAASMNYQAVVLDALREVADAMRAAHHDAEILTSFEEASGAASRALELVERQHAIGTASHPRVLAAKEHALQQEGLVTAARAQRLADTVVLFQVLGGGTAIRVRFDAKQAGPHPAKAEVPSLYAFFRPNRK